MASYIYRASVPESGHSYIRWTDCEGQIITPQFIGGKNRSIDFVAQEGTISSS